MTDIKIYNDIVIHWTDSDGLLSIIKDGNLKCPCSFTDNVNFSQKNIEQFNDITQYIDMHGIIEHSWVYGLIFLKKDLEIDFKEDLIKQGLETPDVPYYKWEREYISDNDVSLSLLYGISHHGLDDEMTKFLEFNFDNVILDLCMTKIFKTSDVKIKFMEYDF